MPRSLFATGACLLSQPSGTRAGAVNQRESPMYDELPHSSTAPEDQSRQARSLAAVGFSASWRGRAARFMKHEFERLDFGPLLESGATGILATWRFKTSNTESSGATRAVRGVAGPESPH